MTTAAAQLQQQTWASSMMSLAGLSSTARSTRPLGSRLLAVILSLLPMGCTFSVGLYPDDSSVRPIPIGS